MESPTPNAEYKPNIYPIMYWALLYGIIAAFVLLVLNLLANFVTLLWFPVFLAGVIWGGYRKYRQDKAAWQQNQGTKNSPKTPVQEFKDAAKDIAQAGREMIARQAQEDEQAAIAAQEAEVIASQEVVPETPVASETPQTPTEEEVITSQEPKGPQTPQSPLQPLV